jgi:hypothetical protein
MEVQYLSDDNIDDTIIYTNYKIDIESRANQPTFEPTFETNYYPPLDKHSSKQIVSMINAIDAINKKLKIEIKQKKHIFKSKARKMYGQYYPWVYI